jgi:hypothetical protein
MQLVARIDTYSSSLDVFMLKCVQADEAHARMHTVPKRMYAEAEDGSDGSDGSDTGEAGYGEDAEYEEKYLRREIIDVELKMNNDFLQIILFLFAVPKEVPLQVRDRSWSGV